MNLQARAAWAEQQVCSVLLLRQQTVAARSQQWHTAPVPMHAPDGGAPWCCCCRAGGDSRRRDKEDHGRGGAQVARLARQRGQEGGGKGMFPAHPQSLHIVLKKIFSAGVVHHAIIFERASSSLSARPSQEARRKEDPARNARPERPRGPTDTVIKRLGELMVRPLASQKRRHPPFRADRAPRPLGTSRSSASFLPSLCAPAPAPAHPPPPTVPPTRPLPVRRRGERE